MGDEVIVVAASDADRKFIRALADRVRGGNCVLLLGPGVAVDPRAADRPLLGTLLAQLLAGDPDMQGRCPPEMQGNLRHVAQLYFQAKRSLEDMHIETSDFYRSFEGLTTDCHRDLAELPFKLIISTTPDDFMLQALRATPGKRPVAAHYDFRRPEAVRIDALPTAAAPLVYYLYGRHARPTSLVLSENDLIEFLVDVVRGEPPLPDYLRGRLGDPETTFLFIGFGFHHWYLRVLLHVLKVYGHTGKAVAIEDSGFFSHPDRPQTVSFFSGDRLVDFRPLPWDSFARQLRDTCLAGMASSSPAAAPEPPADAPEAFLCYADEDRDAVEALGDALQSRGVRVWRDKQNLRTGQRWALALTDIIENGANYVVVVQSASMVSRAEGYFRTEIEVALARRTNFDETKYLFLLPVMLPGGSMMPSLNKLHGGIDIDVVTGTGIDRLAKMILDDWAQPLRRGAGRKPG